MTDKKRRLENARKHLKKIGKKNRNRVLSILDETVWKTRRQIAEETDLSQTTVKKHLRVLIDEDYVEMIPPQPKKGVAFTPGRYQRRF